MLLLFALLLQAGPSDLDAALRQGGARPVPLADADLAERLSRDLVGESMPAGDREAYAADGAAGKYARLVDRLLADERFGRYWAGRFRALWLGDAQAVRFTGIPAFPPEAYAELAAVLEKALASHLRRDQSWVDILNTLLSARGTPQGDPWLAYVLGFRGHESPELAFAAAMPRHLLGVRFDCARCHDHPFEAWNVEDYYRLAAYETRRGVRWKDGDLQVLVRASGSMALPASAGPPKQVDPRFFLTGSEPLAGDDAIEHLARAVSTHPRAARALANRVAAWLFGAGFTSPPDLMDPRIKPLAPGALDLMTSHLKRSGHSLKSIVRLVCLTEEYAARDGEPGFRAAARRQAEGPRPEPWERAPALPFAAPKEWIRLRVSPPYLARFEVPPKHEGGGRAEFFWQRGKVSASGQVDKALQLQESRTTTEGPLSRMSGRMFCDPRADGPYPYLLLAADGPPAKDPGWMRLQGPAETVESWSAEFRLLLGR